jgi:hypothetical protein
VDTVQQRVSSALLLRVIGAGWHRYRPRPRRIRSETASASEVLKYPRRAAVPHLLGSSSQTPRAQNSNSSNVIGTACVRPHLCLARHTKLQSMDVPWPRLSGDAEAALGTIVHVKTDYNHAWVRRSWSVRSWPGRTSCRAIVGLQAEQPGHECQRFRRRFTAAPGGA